MPSKQASPREGEGRSVAERMAREIIPKWTNASAANTMEYENALEAQMMEGHGPVEGLMHAIYTGEVDETVDGFLKFQLLKLGGAGSDEEGPNEVDDATMWGADPVAAFEASRRHEVKPEVPEEDSVTIKAHRKMVKDFVRQADHEGGARRPHFDCLALTSRAAADVELVRLLHRRREVGAAARFHVHAIAVTSSSASRRTTNSDAVWPYG